MAALERKRLERVQRRAVNKEGGSIGSKGAYEVECEDYYASGRGDGGRQSSLAVRE